MAIAEMQLQFGFVFFCSGKEEKMDKPSAILICNYVERKTNCKENYQ